MIVKFAWILFFISLCKFILYFSKLCRISLWWLLHTFLTYISAMKIIRWWLKSVNFIKSFFKDTFYDSHYRSAVLILSADRTRSFELHEKIIGTDIENTITTYLSHNQKQVLLLIRESRWFWGCRQITCRFFLWNPSRRSFIFSIVKCCH